MIYLKAVWKNGYEEKYAIPGTRFYWLNEGGWCLGSTSWAEMSDNITQAGVPLVQWQPTPAEEKKLELKMATRQL